MDERDGVCLDCGFAVDLFKIEIRYIVVWDNISYILKFKFEFELELELDYHIGWLVELHGLNNK